MQGSKLQDRLYFGLGRAARHAGQLADAYRPRGAASPLDKRNRFLRLPAAFLPAKGDAGKTNLYGDPLWHGLFDASYTRPGDYIVLGEHRYFIASQAPMLPVLCVLANRTISITRPNAQSTVAGNPYGGYTAGSGTVTMVGWPASILGESRLGETGAGLPADLSVPYWNVLLPATTGVAISPGDLIADDLGRTATVSGSELTELGWRITAKMATT
jgi:hypothetical protein